MQTNPIQQRIEHFEEDWNSSYIVLDKKLFVIRSTEADWEMTEAFFDYMLGIDNDIEDIAIQFHSPFNTVATYSKELIEELQHTIYLWNNSDKQEGIEDFTIDWQPVTVTGDDKQDSKYFVENMNRFCTSLDLEEDQKLVLILFFNSTQDEAINKWLFGILPLNFHPKLCILLADTYEHPRFEVQLTTFSGKSKLIQANFDLPKAMEQIAAMGDPGAPETRYRFHFMKMANAVAKRENKVVQEQARICLQIAEAQALINAYWYPQIMAVYFTLSNHEIGNKDFKKALTHAEKSLEAIVTATGKLTDEIVFRHIGQAYMLIGSLRQQQKDYYAATKEFQEADKYYERCDDYILQIEALRMVAYCAKKNSDPESRKTALIKGFLLGEKINQAMAEASSYALLVKDFFKIDYEKQVSWEQIDAILIPHFGTNWNEVIEKAGTTAALQ